MKKLLRRWLSIDEILNRQNIIENYIRDKEEAHDNLAEAIDEVQIFNSIKSSKQLKITQSV